MTWQRKTPEDKIQELEEKISDLYGKISDIRMHVGFEDNSYTGNIIERIEKLETTLGDPFRLFSWEGQPTLEALTKMVGEEGEEHVGPKTQRLIITFRILVELNGMRGHLDALARRAEAGAHPDGLDESNMKGKDTKMNQLKQVLLDALGIIDLNDIKKLIELCWKCYDTPITQPGILPQDTILVDRGTRQLVSEIDIMMKKLGKEINFENYIKKED